MVTFARRHPILTICAFAYLMLVHVLLAMAFFAPQMLPDQSWRLGLPPQEPTAYVSERHRLFQQQDREAQPGGIVLLGDSHLENIDTALMPGPVRNYAAGGDTLHNLASRSSAYDNLHSASAIVLWAGYNDMAHRDAEAIGSEFTKTLVSIPPNVPVIALSLSPVADEDKNAEITQISTDFRERCKSDVRCMFADIHAGLVTTDGSLNPSFDRGDGIHLNREGYRVVAETLTQMLEQMEETSP